MRIAALLRVFLFLIVNLLVVLVARAEDSLVRGGKSPDGRYEVRIYQTASKEPSDYYYGVFDTKGHKLIEELSEGATYASYTGAKKTATVLWNPSGHFFALTDHSGRHSMELYVYRVSSTDVALLKMPDYLQNGLDLVHAKGVYLISVVRPQSWTGNTLTCDFLFDAHIETGRSPLYETTFDLTIAQDSKILNLTRMETPKANPND